MNIHKQQPTAGFCHVANIFISLVLVAGLSSTAVAQRVAFQIDQELNPLKRFVIPSNTESHPFLVDIDADGDQDCFVGEYTNGNSKVYFYRNEGNRNNADFKLVNGAANPLNEVLTNTLSIPYLVDIDADGDYDCFVGEGKTGALIYLKNVGSPIQPRFEKQSAAFNPLSMVRYSASGVTSPGFADVDGDGDLDCIVADQAGMLSFFKNVGTASQPHFEHVPNNNNPFAGLGKKEGIYNFSITDWNKDGIPDLFINSTYFKNIGTIKNARFTNGTFDKDAPSLQNAGSGSNSFTQLRLVDLNADGIPEVIQGTGKCGFVYQKIANSKAVQIAKTPPINISPNPSKSTFLLNLAASGTASTIKIMDMQGKVISSRLTSSPSLKFGNELPAGVYVVQVVRQSEVVYNQKIIKER